MKEILLGVALFTLIVMALVALITLARRLLLPVGDVTVRVSGERDLAVKAGRKLLTALADHGLFLPAACGGAGSCGLCRVRVLEGGGAILPTARAHIDRRDDSRRKVHPK